MNYAVAILKTLACLAVVSVHSGGGIPLSGYAVCTFMICSFVFWRVGSEADLVKRLKRLYLPFAVWSMVPWFLRGINGFDFDFGSLVLQLIFGLTESPALYFIVLIAVYSVIVYCVQKSGRFWPVILTGLAVLCFVISQIGVNKGLWDSLPLCGRITCGRGVELFPCCAVGMLIGMGKGSKMRLLMGGGGNTVLPLPLDGLGYRRVWLCESKGSIWGDCRVCCGCLIERLVAADVDEKTGGRDRQADGWDLFCALSAFGRAWLVQGV